MLGPGVYKRSGVTGHGIAFTWPWGPDPHLFWPFSTPPFQHPPPFLSPSRTEVLWAKHSTPCWARPFSTLIVALELIAPTLDVLETQIASAANVPQTLPPTPILPYSNPNTPPQTQGNLQKKNCKIAGLSNKKKRKNKNPQNRTALLLKRFTCFFVLTVNVRPFKLLWKQRPP